MGWQGSLYKAGSKFFSGGKRAIKTSAILGGVGVAVQTVSEKGFTDPTIHPATMDDIIQLQFPLEDASVGGMLTEIRFHSWKKGTGFTIGEMSGPAGQSLNPGINQQTSTQKTDYLGIIRLPMPLQLATGYQGNFTEGDSMNYDRRSGASGSIDKTWGNLRTISLEVKELVNSTINLGNTAQMSNATVDNNNMGMLYKGGALRGHDFSWRLSAKNPEEQIAIQEIVHALKWLSSPANPGQLGGASGTDTKSLSESLAQMKSATGDAKAKMAAQSRFLGGRLAIPPTCTVRFLVDNEENTKLFKVKDSFITNLTTNYTASSGWGAHDDGSPMEVQIGLTIKEIRTITQGDVEAGY
jgi:hypothetical protein